MKRLGLILLILVLISGCAGQRLEMLDAKVDPAELAPGDESVISVKVIDTKGVVTAVTATVREYPDVTLDLNLQTVSLDIFEAATLTNLVSSSTLINPMSNFTELRFESTAGVNNNKIWSLDDFGFQVVAEQATMGRLAMGSLALRLRKRNR